MEKLSDEQMRAKTDEFRERLARGETLDEILPEATRWCARRPGAFSGSARCVSACYQEGKVLPEDTILPVAEADAFEKDLVRQKVRYARERFMAHFDVQMIGAIMLHWGRVAEMKTGEGKTQVAVRRSI